MKLSQLIKDIEVLELNGDSAVEVSGVEFDSRKVKPGTVFVAQKVFMLMDTILYRKHWQTELL